MLKKISIVACVLIVNGYCKEIKNVKTMSLSELENMSSKGYKGYFVDEETFLQSLIDTNESKEATKIVVEHLMDAKKITIDTYDKYIQYYKYTNKPDYIVLTFKDLLKATKYIYDNGIEIEKYNILKPMILEESKKYDFIDQSYFKDDLNNMSSQKINKILKDLKGLI